MSAGAGLLRRINSHTGSTHAAQTAQNTIMLPARNSAGIAVQTTVWPSRHMPSTRTGGVKVGMLVVKLNMQQDRHYPILSDTIIIQAVNYRSD